MEENWNATRIALWPRWARLDRDGWHDLVLRTGRVPTDPAYWLVQYAVAQVKDSDDTRGLMLLGVLLNGFVLANRAHVLQEAWWKSAGCQRQ